MAHFLELDVNGQKLLKKFVNILKKQKRGDFQNTLKLIEECAKDNNFELYQHGDNNFLCPNNTYGAIMNFYIDDSEYIYYSLL